MINEYQKNKSDKMKKVEQFLQELLNCCSKAQATRNDAQKDRCDFLSVFYESEPIKKMAIQDFGF
jgi:hypothetical protein